MGEEETATITLPPSSLPKKPSSFSYSIRFLGLLKQPDYDPNPNDHLEFDERDVVWPSDISDFSSAVDPVDLTFSPESKSSPSTDRIYSSSGFGLSAVFAEDQSLTVRRPTRSVKKAARIGSGSELLAKSAPVNVPTWQRRRGRGFDDALDEVEEGEGEEVEEEGDDEEMVPPHVIVARSHVMTFSVFEGVGRTLKGRDLRRVRNAVFQKTGFLD